MKKYLLLLITVSTVYCQIGTHCYYDDVIYGTCQSHCDFAVLREMSRLRMFKLCGENLLCCIDKSFISTTTTPANLPSRRATRISEQKCEEYSKQLLGVTIGELGDKIVGGRNASAGEYPHMAALGYGIIPDIKWLCGGSLISDRYVLTAAHCRASDQYGEVKYVRLGFIDMGKEQGIIFDVNKFIISEQYSSPSIYNDIAIIELNRPVSFDGYIKPACLYTDYFKNLPQESVTATGWGLTSFGGSASRILQTVDLKIYRNCSDYYGVNRRKYNEGIIESQLCAGSEEERDTCTGDSGGPLQVLDFRRKLHVVLGVTSTGGICGSSRPAIYTRVSSHIDWIERIVWSEINN